jgi:hypothetical protein
MEFLSGLNQGTPKHAKKESEWLPSGKKGQIRTLLAKFLVPQFIENGRRGRSVKRNQ